MHPQRAVGLDILKGKMTFQRKTESLDWKKIASINIENLIQEGDTSQLGELINCVTFCKADSEFDQARMDPGFIKVFRISQLISECLLASHEGWREKLTTLQEQYNERGKEKEKLSEEILHLKETLTSAKKELRKRKEMLASSQNEILGQNNSDEYDQCPYCIKKFMTTGYLLAHVQRRHQGLPVNPLYPSPPPGGTTTTAAMLCHHHLIQSQTLGTHPPPLQTPQSLAGSFESGVAANASQSPHHPLINHLLPHPQQSSSSPFPVIQLPATSILYGINQAVSGQLNTPSFSGSVTSLNQIPSTPAKANNDQDNNTASGEQHPKVNSSTQTSTTNPDNNVDEANRNGVVPPEVVHENGRKGGGSSPSLRNVELAERTVRAGDVMRLQDEFDERWQSLGEKVRQSGIEELNDAMIASFFGYAATRSPNQSPSPHANNDDGGSDNNFPKRNPFLRATVNPEDGEVGMLTRNNREVDQVQQRERKEKGKRFADVGLNTEEETVIEREILGRDTDEETDQANNNKRNVSCEKKDSFTQTTVVVAKQNGADDGVDPDQDDGESDYSHSESPDIVHVDHNESNDEPEGNQQVADHPRGKSPVKQKQTRARRKDPVMLAPDKVPSFNNICLLSQKIAEMLLKKDDHDEDDDDEKDDRSRNSTDANNSGDDDDDDVDDVDREHRHHQEGKSSTMKSQLDQVRARTVTELERNMSDIGINPKRTAIGLEEMGRVLKQLKSQQRRASFEDLIPVNRDGEGDDDDKESGDDDNEHDENGSYPKTKSSSQTVIPYGGDGGGDAEQKSVKSDDISDYTLSESLVITRDDHNEQQDDPDRRSPHGDHSRGKSSVKQTPPVRKKKYRFDKDARKVVEVSSNEEDDYDDERSSNSSEVNNSAEDDNDGDRNDGGKSRKSQLDLVRAKTIMELEKNMADIGLNPESTAIGLEEMGRALKHLKSQRRTSSGDQIQDQEQFELERNAVKSFAKFAATKSTIDEKLEAISSLNASKPQPNSFARMFSAVKISGKNFRKRVASAVKRRQKEHSSGEDSGDDDDDENKAGGDAKTEKKGKRKAASAPPLKTTFFSKARWTRKKKAKDTSATTASTGKKASSGEKEEDKENDSESGTSTEEESGEEIVLHPYMTRSKPLLPRRRSSTRSTRRGSREERRSSSNSSTRRSTRKSRSFGKSNKPLKRLNSSANSNSSPNSSSATYTSGTRKGGTTGTDRNNMDEDDDDENIHDGIDQVSDPFRRRATRARGNSSSDTSPFSNVDEYENVTNPDRNDHHDHDDGESMYESPDEESAKTPIKRFQRNVAVAMARGSGQVETVQVKSAFAVPVPDVDKADSSDLEEDINDLLNMSDDDMRKGGRQQRSATTTQHQPQQPSFGLNNSFKRRNVGAMMQPTHHGRGLQRSNNPPGAVMARGRGLRNSSEFTVHNNRDPDRDRASPANSWDSWNSRR